MTTPSELPAGGLESPSTWEQVPQPPARTTSPWRTSFADVALLAWVAVAGPLLRAARLPASEPLQVAVVGVAAVAATVALRRAPQWAPIGVGLAAGAALLPGQGETIAAWLGAGLVIGAWAAFGRAPLPRLPDATADARAPVAVLAAVAAWQGADPAATWQPFVPLALAAAMPALGGLGGGALHRAAAWLGRTAGDVVATVVFGVLGLLAVLAPWLVQRPVGVDPLATRRGWIPRDALPVGPRRPWSDDPAATRRPFGERARGPLAVLAATAVVVGVVVWQQGADEREEQAAVERVLSEAPGDLESAAWYAELREDMAWVLDDRVGLRPFEVYRVLDVETRHVNVRDGERLSWRAPACDCERVQLWLYGGGAVFGLEQRDQHTIASQLAKLAYEDGLVVDVRNRGIPEQMHWRTSFRFSWDLTWEDAPDLVAFYDGVEEVSSALVLSERGLGDTRAPFEPYSELLYEELFDVPAQLEPPPGVDDIAWPTVSDLPNDDPGRLAVVRYDRARQMSRDAAAGAEVPIRWFWQPTSHAHPPSERRLEAGSDGTDPTRAAAFSRAVALLDEEVVDLTDVFSAEEEPIFADEAHHSERGARLVAEAMYRVLEPQLRALAAGRAP